MSSPKKNKVIYSIITPAYNQSQSLKKQLAALISFAPNNGEVIVIDDGSTDDTHILINKESKKPNLRFKVQYKSLRTNRGPAYARNVGAKHAQGKIIIFLDADALPYKNSLKNVLTFFQKNPSVKAVSGFWAKIQAKKSFFTEYKALRDWSYFFQEAQKTGVSYFTPRVAAIKKEVFLRLGGFDTRFKKPELESLEFSFRLEKVTRIHFLPSFLVRHQFAGAWVQTRNYFKRTYFFLRLFSRHHQFSRTVSTEKEAVNVFLAAALLLTPTIILFNPPFSFLILTLSFLILITYLYRQKKFLSFFYSQKGALFTLKSFFFNWFLHLAIFAGVIYFVLELPSRWLRLRK